MLEYMGYLDPTTNKPTLIEGFDWPTYVNLPAQTRYHILASSPANARATLVFCLTQLSTSKWKR